MGQVLVRNLEDSVVERLKSKAADANKSLEQYLRDLLTQSAQSVSDDELLAIAQRVRAQVKPGPDPADIIREDRDTDHGRSPL